MIFFQSSSNDKNYFASILGITLLLLGAAFILGVANPGWVNGAAVTVSATVNSSVTCTTNITTTSFGTLSSGSITTASPDASTTLSCNDSLGCTLNIHDSNHGLATTSPAYTISSVDATLVAGTEGYGIQATTSAAGTGSINVDPKYLLLLTGNTVGLVTTTDHILASSSVSLSNKEVRVVHKAAISGTTEAANYTDTITYSCTGN